MRFGLAAAALATLLAAACSRQPEDATTRLLRQLPAQQAVYLYLDVAQARESPSLDPLLGSAAALPPDLSHLANAAGLNYPADVDGVAVSMGTKGTHFAVQGRFNEARLTEAMKSNGAVCGQTLRQTPCTVEALGSRPPLELLLRAEDLLRVAVGSEISEPRLSADTDFEKMLVQARERLDRRDVLWASFDPGRAEEALRHPSNGFANLRFFARALQKAERGYFYADTLPDGTVQVTLKASCADPHEAASVSNLLNGLNRLAVAALEAGSGDAPPPPTAQVLRRARIASTETTVVAIWVLDEPTLRAWVGQG